MNKSNIISKVQFMLKCAKKEWRGSCEFTKLGVMEYLSIPAKHVDKKFDEIPNRYQKRLAKFAEEELEYSDDWNQKQELVAQ